MKHDPWIGAHLACGLLITAMWAARWHAREAVPLTATFDLMAGATYDGTIELLNRIEDERAKQANETLDNIPERDIDFNYSVAIE